MVTLYIGKCVNSGKQYFGKTTVYHTKEDLQKNYWGSGPEWIKHYSEWGNEVLMEVYWTGDVKDVEAVALEFSRKNNITSSNDWLNQKPENGYDGGFTKESYEKGLQKIKWLTKNDEEWMNEKKEVFSKTIKSKYENGYENPFTGCKHSKESIEKMRGQTHQKGEGNSQYGTMWIYNPKLKESKKVPKGDVPDGWLKGRKIKW